MAYAVHTEGCTYLLDDDGVCRWIVAPQGVVPRDLRQCIGAQFVASVDMSVEGGLVGDLRSGARALFVRASEDRIIMMRTGLVTRVDDRRAGPPTSVPPAAAVTAPSSAYGARAAGSRQHPGPTFGVVSYAGDGQTLTLTVSLSEDWPKRTVRR